MKPAIPSVSLWRAVAREPVALGLAAVVFFRPWRDGLTYVSFNTYFLWLIIALAALWGVRLLLRGGPLRHAIPLALFAAFLGIALLTGIDSVQRDATYRSLLFWTGHFFLFALCTNALKTRMALGIVLAAFVVSLSANAFWAIFHYHYILPMMREMVRDNPAVLQQFFGQSELTLDLKHRLEVNRAFGTLLFPNALAAVMILGIPVTLGFLRPAYAKWRVAMRGDGATAYTLSPWGAAAAVWASSIVTALVLSLYVVNIFLRRQDPSAFWYVAGFLLVAMPLAAAIGSALSVRKFGFPTVWYAALLAGLSAGVVLQSIALWLTYSRGGAMGIVAAGVLSAALYLAAGKRLPRAGKGVRIAAAMVVWAAAAGLLAGVPSVAQGPPADGRIQLEGVDLTPSDLLNTGSFQLRVTYWKVGLRMAADNLWTGVGLGNFGTAYANYQYRGAGDVQAAHNDYLQALCETGVFGFLAFCAFWLYFAAWGARRILRETDSLQRWVLSGLYAATIAFLVHSLVDFNFYNPSLVSLAMFVAGVFYALASEVPGATPPQDGGRKKLARHQIMALPILLVVALTMGAALRVYIVDWLLTEGDLVGSMVRVGNRSVMRDRLATGRFFLKEIQDPKRDRQFAPRIPLFRAQLLIPDLGELQGLGSFRVVVPGNPPSLRPLSQGEVPPENAFLFVTDGEKARNMALPMAEVATDFLEQVDAIFPYIPEVSMTLYEWYTLMQEAAQDPVLKKKYVTSALKWAQAGVERNPRQAWFHEWLGTAIMLDAYVKGGNDAAAKYRRALDEYRKACDLYPISPRSWGQLATALEKVGAAFVQAGAKDEGARLAAEAAKAREKSNSLSAPPGAA